MQRRGELRTAMTALRGGNCRPLDADERDRVDFIYYLPGGAFVLKRVEVVGPSSSVVWSERIRETGGDTFIEPLGVWPTDHKGVLATFVLGQQ